MTLLRAINNNAIDLHGKIVLLRVDFNVPMHGGAITDDTRIKTALPTINHILQNGAEKLVIISHFGRPKGYDESASLSPVAQHLSKLMGADVTFLPGIITEDAPAQVKADSGRVVMLDNLRFNAGETSNSAEFAGILAKCADIYVNDAFSCSHRAHASVEAIAGYLPAYAGISLSYEVESLSLATSAAVSPTMAIIGGAKISTKLELLTNLITQLDYLAIGGAMANNFFLAQGYQVGSSLVESELLDITLNIIQQAQKYNCHLILPTQVVTAPSLHSTSCSLKPYTQVEAGESIFDLGPDSIEQIISCAEKCRMVLWNGPVGAFELPLFANGSANLARSLANMAEKGVKVIAGGGDTLSAINSAQAKGFYYLSTAGGAFLEWLEGKKLPGIEVLLRPIK